MLVRKSLDCGRKSKHNDPPKEATEEKKKSDAKKMVLIKRKGVKTAQHIFKLDTPDQIVITWNLCKTTRVTGSHLRRG